MALVGETGAGKSTLLKLLVRFVDPDAGRVVADGCDLRTLDLGWYRSHVGYVPQEAFIFSGTIRENITLGRPDACLRDVIDAAQAVGAHELIERLPDGYDTVVGERGRALSVGERQLVSLARALLVDPAVVLVDEATASLDPQLDAAVVQAMERAGRGRTMIVIAHRLSTAPRLDRVVVVSRGAVIENGTHEELLDVDGWYRAA